MAGVSVDGLEGLMESFDALADLPEDLMDDMLNAEADVVVRAQKDAVSALGMVDTGQLKDSIRKNQKTGTGSMGKYLDIYPQGVRDDGVRNAEVGFIHEFGAPRKHIPASGWMKQANEQCTDEAVSAAEAVYQEYLNENNL